MTKATSSAALPPQREQLTKPTGPQAPIDTADNAAASAASALAPNRLPPAVTVTVLCDGAGVERAGRAAFRLGRQVSGPDLAARAELAATVLVSHMARTHRYADSARITLRARLMARESQLMLSAIDTETLLPVCGLWEDLLHRLHATGNADAGARGMTGGRVLWASLRIYPLAHVRYTWLPREGARHPRNTYGDCETPHLARAEAQAAYNRVYDGVELAAVHVQEQDGTPWRLIEPIPDGS